MNQVLGAVNRVLSSFVPGLFDVDLPPTHPVTSMCPSKGWPQLFRDPINLIEVRGPRRVFTAFTLFTLRVSGVNNLVQREGLWWTRRPSLEISYSTQR